jgi:hypothetical protein
MIETAIFDSRGQPVLRILANGRIVDFNGISIGFIRDINVYDYNGDHRGFFEGGILRDHSGCTVGFGDKVTSAVYPVLLPPKRPSPLLTDPELEPLRPLPQLPPIQPLSKPIWSNLEPLELFML